jgi:hypothetical protein
LFVPAQGTVLDTRTGVGGVSGPVAAYTWYPVQVAGLAGVPASGVSSVQVSVTAFNPSLSGYLKLAADGAADAQTSALLYTGGGGSFSASSIVALGADGKIKVLAQRSVSLLIAVQGYYTVGDGDPAPGDYVPVHPARLVDTRAGTGLPQAKLAVGSTTSISVGGLAGVPADASAVFVMLTGISSSSVAAPSPRIRPAPPSRPTWHSPIWPIRRPLWARPSTSAPVGSSTCRLPPLAPLSMWWSTSSATTAPAREPVVPSLRPRPGFMTPASPPGVEIPGSATRKLPVGGIAGVPLPSTGISAYALSLQVLHPGPNIGFVAVGPGDENHSLRLLGLSDAG